MPCDTVSLIQLKLSASNPEHLTKALAELGHTPRWNTDRTIVSFGYGESFNRATGEIRVRDSATVSKIQQAYQKAQLYANAKKYGWQIKQTATNKYQVIKR